MEFRHEYKHRINLSDRIQLKRRLEAVAEHDGYCGEDGTYFVKSLYFDNYMDKALREKFDGVNQREKFRIRYYGSDTSFIRLEKKSKTNGLCSKQSAVLTHAQCRRLLDGDSSFLLESGNNLMREFYAKMRYQLLRPKCIVAYRRESFVYPPGNVRIALDFDIGSSYSVREFLNPGLQFLPLGRASILEVKWDEYLPQVIRDAVQMGSRKTTAFSKYAAARL